MEVDLPLGFHFQPTDEEILSYLRYYVLNGRPLPCGFIVEEDLRYFQVEQPPDASMSGSSGKLYYYVDCFYKHLESAHPIRDRRTVGERGFWRCTKGQSPVSGEDGQIMGYKQDFRFSSLEAGKAVSTPWVMTEYTLEPSISYNNKKAICVLRKTRERRYRSV